MRLKIAQVLTKNNKQERHAKQQESMANTEKEKYSIGTVLEEVLEDTELTRQKL